MDQREPKRVQQDLARAHEGRFGPGGAECEMIGMDAAEHRVHGGRDVEPLERAGDGGEAGAPAGSARVLGAVEPGSGIERGDDGAQDLDIGMAERVGRELERAVEAAALRAHLGEGFRVPRGGGAQSVQRVGAPADLLEDRVVGNGAKLAGMAKPRAAQHPVDLAGGGA